MLDNTKFDAKKIDDVLQRFAVKVVHKGRHQQVFNASGDLENLEEIKLQTKDIQVTKAETLNELLGLLT